MTITRKDLQEDIKHLQVIIHLFMRIKLKEIINLYEKFVRLLDRHYTGI